MEEESSGEHGELRLAVQHGTSKDRQLPLHVIIAYGNYNVIFEKQFNIKLHDVDSSTRNVIKS
jgi:hypothetical protein